MAFCFRSSIPMPVGPCGRADRFAFYSPVAQASRLVKSDVHGGWPGDSILIDFVIEPLQPFTEARLLCTRGFYDPDIWIDGPGVGLCLLQVERDVRQQVGLVDDH